MVEKTLINKVKNSGLITLNLEEDYPTSEFVDFDLKSYLFMELILKEKDFRAALKAIDWTTYQDKILLVYCSADAIIPVWAYMLVAAYAKPYALDIYNGQKAPYLEAYYSKLIRSRNYSEYKEKRIVIKGCSNKPVPTSAYLELTAALQPYAQSIMFGEPCSTVPIFKRPRLLKK
jgi:hypothetical protein